MAEPLGYALRDFAAEERMIDVELDFRISSGLVRPDYFDWWERMWLLLSGPTRFDTVVWFSGGNDAQPLRNAEGTLAVGTTEWESEYRSRAGALMDVVESAGARMIWVALPPVRDEARAVAARQINAAARAAATDRAGVAVIDLDGMFASADGGYTPFAVGPDGRTLRVRQDDGVHLTSEGTRWVADAVYGRVLADAGLERPARE
jgi:hypothetical protein